MPTSDRFILASFPGIPLTWPVPPGALGAADEAKCSSSLGARASQLRAFQHGPGSRKTKSSWNSSTSCLLTQKSAHVFLKEDLSFYDRLCLLLCVKDKCPKSFVPRSHRREDDGPGERVACGRGCRANALSPNRLASLSKNLCFSKYGGFRTFELINGGKA